MNTEKDLLEMGLVIDATATKHLKETAGWAKFIAISGFIYTGLIIAGSLFLGAWFYKLSKATNPAGGLIGGIGLAVFYIIISGIIFFMSFYLFRYSKQTRAALLLSDQEMLTSSFRNMMIYFRLFGIVTIVGLVFGIIGTIGIAMAAALSFPS